MKDLA